MTHIHLCFLWRNTWVLPLAKKLTELQLVRCRDVFPRNKLREKVSFELLRSRRSRRRSFLGRFRANLIAGRSPHSLTLMFLPSNHRVMSFAVSRAQGKPALVISNYKLEGKVVPEKKPLLVLRKVVMPEDEEDDQGEDSGEGRDRDRGQPRVQYQIVGKITSKTIFKARPKPLIRKVGTSTSGSRKYF